VDRAAMHADDAITSLEWQRSNLGLHRRRGRGVRCPWLTWSLDHSLRKSCDEHARVPRDQASERRRVV
jgi:hypothetical protein